MAAPSVPLYDLSKLPSIYPDPLTLRAAYLNLARWAHKAERWEDMARIMREVVRAATAGLLGPAPVPNASILMRITGLDGPLPTAASPVTSALFASQANPPPAPLPMDPRDISSEERQLLFLAYKQLITQLRQAWRAIHPDDTAGGGKEAKLIDEYKHQLEREILIVCSDLTQLLDTTLIATVTVAEGKVFYLKMAADFFRYLAEVANGVNGLSPPHLLPPPTPSSQVASLSAVIPAGYDKKAAEYYAAAHKIALASLDPTHPTRLGLCLNYSVLLMEVLRDRKQACELARQSFDAAIGRLDEVEEANYKESTLMMQLLRDNLTLWTSHEQEGQ